MDLTKTKCISKNHKRSTGNRPYSFSRAVLTHRSLHILCTFLNDKIIKGSEFAVGKFCNAHSKRHIIVLLYGVSPLSYGLFVCKIKTGDVIVVIGRYPRLTELSLAE